MIADGPPVHRATAPARSRGAESALRIPAGERMPRYVAFLRGAQEWNAALTKRDLTCNINFFMNVPVTPEGHLTFADGISAPGRYVEMIARMDVVCLISNCPQLNNPCNGWNPTPVEVLIFQEPLSPRMEPATGSAIP